jgi:hypothetical protein
MEQKDEVSGQFRLLHNEEICDSYWSRTTGWVVKSRSSWQAGHMSRVESWNDYRMRRKFRWRSPSENGRFEDLERTGMTKLRWTLDRQHGDGRWVVKSAQDRVQLWMLAAWITGFNYPRVESKYVSAALDECTPHPQTLPFGIHIGTVFIFRSTVE